MGMTRRIETLLLMVIVPFVWMGGCTFSEKTVPLKPLEVGLDVPQQADAWTRQGMREYEQGRYDDAKALFGQVVAESPKSGEAHYNFALALYALGKSREAKEHFLTAASLAPGHKVIWDSPPLRPHGSPEPTLKDGEGPPPAGIPSGILGGGGGGLGGEGY